MKEGVANQNRFAAFGEGEPARPAFPARATLPPVRGSYSGWKKQEEKKPENQAKKLEMNDMNFPTLADTPRPITKSGLHSKSLADRLKDAMSKEEEEAMKRRAGIWTEKEYEQPANTMISLPLRRGKFTVVCSDLDAPFPKSRPAAKLPALRPSHEADAEREEELRLEWQSSMEMDMSCFSADDEEPEEDETMDDLEEEAAATVEESAEHDS